MSMVSLILLILGVVEPALATSGVIPTQYQNLAEGILKAVSAIKAELTGSNGQLTVNAVTLLQVIASGFQILQAQGVLPPGMARLSDAFIKASEKGLAAYEQSLTKVDPTTLGPISPAS